MMVPSVTIQVVAERVLNSIPEGLLIAAFAWLLLRVIGRQNSRTRFAIWFISLVAIAVLPFVPAPQFGHSLRHAAHAEFVFPAAWAPWSVTAWGVVAFFPLARLGFGLVRLEKLRCESIPVREDELAPSLLATIEECRSLRAVDVRVSDEVRVPT